MSIDTKRIQDELRKPFLLACAAFVVLAIFSAHPWREARAGFWHQSKAPHFVYQAMAFMQGKLELAVNPPNIEDWSCIHSRTGQVCTPQDAGAPDAKWYSTFPAFPALLMVPFVAVNGYQLNDTSFTVIIAALNLMALFFALRGFSKSGDSERSDRENLILCALLCFGSLYFYCAIRGEVWFTAEVMGVGLTALYVLFAHRTKNPALAGLFYSAGTLTRTPIMFSAVFFLCELFAPNGTLAELTSKVERSARRAQWKKLGQFALGAAPLALWHAWMNWARFGSMSDFGHAHLFDNRVNADIQRWGLFNPHYLERNVVAAFLLLPKTVGSQLFYNPHGLSLLLTTPLFVLALFPEIKNRKDRFLAALGGAVAAVLISNWFDRGPEQRSPYLAPEFGSTAFVIFFLFAARIAFMLYETREKDEARPRLLLALVATLAAMALPGLFYQNDGYVQFGFRFSLDWTPYMFFLLAVGRRKFDRVFWALAAVGVVVSTWGAIAFRGFSDMG